MGGGSSWCGKGFYGAVAKPAIVVSEVAGGFYGLKMFSIREVESAFINARGLEDVDVAG